MENLLLYLIIAAGLAMMLAGAYGAAPSLFPRRPLDGPGVHHAVGPIFALGGAFPLLANDLAYPMAAASVPSSSTLATLQASQEDENDADDLLSDSSPAGEPVEVDEMLLTDLLSEIEMLRGQIQGLRSELTIFAAKAAALQSQPTAANGESRRRPRSQSSAGLPLPLQRRVVDIKRQRRSA